MISLSEINLSQIKSYVSPGNHTHDCQAGFQLSGSLLTEVERNLMTNSPFSRAAEPKGICWNPCGAEYFGRENAACMFSAGNWVFLCVTLILKNDIHWLSNTLEIIQKMSEWDNYCIYLFCLPEFSRLLWFLHTKRCSPSLICLNWCN